MLNNNPIELNYELKEDEYKTETKNCEIQGLNTLNNIGKKVYINKITFFGACISLLVFVCLMVLRFMEGSITFREFTLGVGLIVGLVFVIYLTYESFGNTESK